MMTKPCSRCGFQHDEQNYCATAGAMPDLQPASDAGELISKTEAVRILETAAHLADPDGVITNTSTTDPEYLRLASLRNTLKSAATAIRALPTVPAAADAEAIRRAAIEKTADVMSDWYSTMDSEDSVVLLKKVAADLNTQLESLEVEVNGK